MHPLLQKAIVSVISSVCREAVAGKSGTPPWVFAITLLSRIRKTEACGLIGLSVLAPLVRNLLQSEPPPRAATGPQKKRCAAKHRHCPANALAGLALAGAAFLFYGITRVRRK